MQDCYNIFYDGKKIYSSLTEEEYFDIMEDLAVEFYLTGLPDPKDLKTEIIGNHLKLWQKQKLD